MATLFTIPVGNVLPWMTFKITLSNVIYSLDFKYNTRMQRWTMDINDPSQNPLLTGIPLLIERNLTFQYFYLAIPPGVFFCTDDTGQETQPTLFSFGLDHTLFYVDPTQ